MTEQEKPLSEWIKFVDEAYKYADVEDVAADLYEKWPRISAYLKTSGGYKLSSAQYKQERDRYQREAAFLREVIQHTLESLKIFRSHQNIRDDLMVQLKKADEIRGDR